MALTSSPSIVETSKDHDRAGQRRDQRRGTVELADLQLPGYAHRSSGGPAIVMIPMQHLAKGNELECIEGAACTGSDFPTHNEDGIEVVHNLKSFAGKKAQYGHAIESCTSYADLEQLNLETYSKIRYNDNDAKEVIRALTNVKFLFD